MKKYGMLMTPDLAQKAHDGDKTVTRRLIKPQPPKWWDTCHWDDPDAHYKPRYRPGMIVAIKEYHWRFGYKYKNNKGNWAFMPKTFKTGPRNHTGACDRDHVIFREPNIKTDDPTALGYHAISGLFLPFDYARTHVEILDVRPERVWDIDGPDALNEGLWFTEDGPLHWHYNMDGFSHNFETMAEAFKSLWDSINPKYPFAGNPWDWRYAFKRVEKP